MPGGAQSLAESEGSHFVQLVVAGRGGECGGIVSGPLEGIEGQIRHPPGVGAGLGGLAVRRIGYRNTFLVFTAGFVFATVAAFLHLVDDRPPEDERRWQRPRDEFEDGDLV